MRVSAWWKCTCVTVCNVACSITCLLSVCFVSDTLIESVDLCEVLSVSLLHLLKILQLRAVRVSELLYRDLKNNISLWRSVWCVLCACMYKGKIFLVCSQFLNDWLTGALLHPQTEEVPCHGDGPSYHGCCDSLVWITIFHLLNCIRMVICNIWFSVLIFCFSVNVTVCDAVRFFFVPMAH